MFSEKTTPISELIKGSPEKPLREPTLAILACLFNGFQIYQLLQILPQFYPGEPMDPYSWLSVIIGGTVLVLIGWYALFIILLLIGAGIIYFLNRRAGGAIILAFSIVGLILGIVGLIVTFLFTFSFLSIFTGLLAPIFGIFAGSLGVRSERPRTIREFQEIV